MQGMLLHRAPSQEPLALYQEWCPSYGQHPGPLIRTCSNPMQLLPSRLCLSADCAIHNNGLAILSRRNTSPTCAAPPPTPMAAMPPVGAAVPTPHLPPPAPAPTTSGWAPAPPSPPPQSSPGPSSATHSQGTAAICSPSLICHRPRSLCASGK